MAKNATSDDLVRELKQELRVRHTLTLSLRVQPKARRTELVERLADGSVKVRVSAPPVEGAANEAVCQLLCEVLNLSRQDIALLSGATARRKIVRINVPTSGV
jgi:uncharacterized protein